MIEKPEMIVELVERISDVCCACLRRVLGRVRVDYAAFYEPIASNTGPVISPEMFERFALRGYRKVLELLREHHIPLSILCTTGGNLSGLLPGLLDAGINGLWVSNLRLAGLSYHELRQEYGDNLALIGGVDSFALSEDANAVRQAVFSTVPALLQSGRYLPCLDDRPRSHISFAQYSLFRQLLAGIATAS